MLKVTSGAFHEKLSAGSEELILNGPPDDLRGHISIRNKNNEALKVKSLPLSRDRKFSNQPEGESMINLSCKLNPGEEKMVEVWHQINFTTPPGTYENLMMVGGEERKVTIIVQQKISIELFPSDFSFTGSQPGTVHTAIFTITNFGNVPFQVPEVKHVAALDMDFFCRAFGMGMRSNGHEGVIKMLDEVTRNMQSHLAQWANAHIDENGKTLQPGEKSVIHLHITMPENSDSNKDYNGNIRFWDKDISYSVKAQ